MDAAQDFAVMRLVVLGVGLPGRVFRGPDGRLFADVHVGVQIRDTAADLVAGDAAAARWELDVRVHAEPGGGFEFAGQAVHGRRGERFVYLSWGNVTAGGHFERFRRAKLMLSRVEPALVGAALAGDAGLVATVELADERGGPRCARVDPPAISWSAG